MFQTRREADFLFDLVDVLRVAADQLAPISEVADEVVGCGRFDLTDFLPEGGGKGVKDGRSHGIRPDGNIEEVTALECRR